MVDPASQFLALVWEAERVFQGGGWLPPPSVVGLSHVLLDTGNPGLVITSTLFPVFCHSEGSVSKVCLLHTQSRFALFLTVSSDLWTQHNTTHTLTTRGHQYRVTRRVFSKSVTSKLHILFKKNLAGSLKTLKVTRISAMYTNISHSPVHSGPSKFSRPKIWNWYLGNTKANKNLLID